MIFTHLNRYFKYKVFFFFRFLLLFFLIFNFVELHSFMESEVIVKTFIKLSMCKQMNSNETNVKTKKIELTKNNQNLWIEMEKKLCAHAVVGIIWIFFPILSIVSSLSIHRFQLSIHLNQFFSHYSGSNIHNPF